MTDLTDLLVRVEGASGPDRELDALIVSAIAGGEFEGSTPLRGKPGRVSLYGVNGSVMAADVTRSLDAALALVERAGGGKLMVENLGEMRSAGEWTGHWLAQLGPRAPRPRMEGPITAGNLRKVIDGYDCTSAPTAPLALLAALLRALIAKSSDPQPPVSERSGEDGSA